VSFEDQLKNIASDLLNLEICTVLKPVCSGRKMPTPRRALHQIARKYDVRLHINKDRGKDAVTLGSFQSFELFVEKSRETINTLKDKMSSGEEIDEECEHSYWMLYRINSISEEIIKVLRLNKIDKSDYEKSYSNIDDYPEIKLTVDQLVKIRKAWELGVEEVVMQTVVQIDGDVITRIQPKYANEKYKTLHEIHNLGINTSVNFWQSLVLLLTTILGKAKAIFQNI